MTTAGARMANALIGAARAEKWQSPDGKIHLLGIGGDDEGLAEIARRYANTVTKYKSMAAAHADIAAPFTQRARFASKVG